MLSSLAEPRQITLETCEIFWQASVSKANPRDANHYQWLHDRSAVPEPIKSFAMQIWQDGHVQPRLRQE